MTPEELQAQQAEQREEDLRWLLDHERGRRVLFALIDGAGTFDTSFTGNSGSFYKDGRKSVGLDLFKEVMALEPERFTQMWQEHQAAEAEAAAKLDEQED